MIVIMIFIIQNGSSNGNGEVETTIGHKQVHLELLIYLAKGGRMSVWHATSLAH
jgi:hypothetical protein